MTGHVLSHARSMQGWLVCLEDSIAGIIKEVVTVQSLTDLCQKVYQSIRSTTNT